MINDTTSTVGTITGTTLMENFIETTQIGASGYFIIPPLIVLAICFIITREKKTLGTIYLPMAVLFNMLGFTITPTVFVIAGLVFGLSIMKLDIGDEIVQTIRTTFGRKK